MGAPHAAADSAIQPDPTGSLLFSRLVKNADGSLKTNGTGGYHVVTPYTDNDITRKVGRLKTDGLCTASVLDTPSGTLAITARHCTDGAEDRIDAGRATFTPGWHEGQRPYGDWVVDRVFTSDAPVDGSVPDVAVLAIRPTGDAGSRRVVSAATGGGLKVHPALSSTQTVQATLLGYPGPAPYDLVRMSACVGDYTYFPGKGRKAVHRITTQDECWVGGGSSGGPYVTGTSAGPQIITVLNSNGGSAISNVSAALITDAESWVYNKYPDLVRKPGDGLPSTGSDGSSALSFGS
ncbi:trypsin-like serine peptidase [Rhodococcus daqingensis]|uniref:Trypsin-like serine peptidase n=1 Tax=Rhodococcus daqingensis TaxID=2479363 RepID=A0ABW2RW96_9NOCA